MLTCHVTEYINEVSRIRRRRTTTTQVITRSFGRWPQTKIAKVGIKCCQIRANPKITSTTVKIVPKWRKNSPNLVTLIKT